MDATPRDKDAHRWTNSTQTVSRLSDDERSESMVDRRPENS